MNLIQLLKFIRGLKKFLLDSIAGDKDVVEASKDIGHLKTGADYQIWKEHGS